MKKEKTVKTYQRRTKSGKMVTVKQHTAKYDAADRAKEMASKEGAGDELTAKKEKIWQLPMNEFLKKLKEKDAAKKEQETPDVQKTEAAPKKTPKSVKSTKTTKNAATTQANGVSASDFKSWYHFNDWDKPKKSWPAEVRAADAAIRKQLGSKKAYDDYCSQIDSSYSKSGHNKAFKSFGGGAVKSDRKQGDIIPFSKGDKELKKSGTHYVDKDGMRYVKVTGKGYRYTGVAASKGSAKDDTMGKSPAKMTKGDRAVAKMNKLVNEALSSTTSEPKALKKQLRALIDYNGGPINRGDKIGKRMDEIREQLGKRSSSNKGKGGFISHIDGSTFWTKEIKSKKVGNQFSYSEGKGKDKMTYAAHFVTNGKGGYSVVINDGEKPTNRSGWATAVFDGYKNYSQLPAGIRKAAKEQGLTFKNGEFVKRITIRDLNTNRAYEKVRNRRSYYQMKKDQINH